MTTAGDTIRKRARDIALVRELRSASLHDPTLDAILLGEMVEPPLSWLNWFIDEVLAPAVARNCTQDGPTAFGNRIEELLLDLNSRRIELRDR